MVFTFIAARTIATSWSFSDLASMAKAAVRPLAAQVQVLLKRFQGLQWRLTSNDHGSGEKTLLTSS